MDFIWILLWIAFVAVISRIWEFKREELVFGRAELRCPWSWAIVLLIPLLFLCAFRGYVGDTYAYEKIFKDMPSTWEALGEYIATLTKDEGFYIFSALIKIFITHNVKVYFFILAAIQGLLLFSVYRKYSTRFLISFFLFIASTDYISWMCNGVRQFMAVSITFACLPLLLKKKYIPAILIAIFASTFHSTALLVIPFYFLVGGKAWNIRTMAFLLGVIAAVVFVDKFTPFLESLLQETPYENVVSDWKEWEDDGTNIFRVVVYSVPVLLSVIGLRFIREANDPLINICVNMSIVSMGFYIISIFTSGIFIGRLPIYFSLYNYILLPWEIDHMFTKRSARLMFHLMVIAYLLFYLYSIMNF